jgi:hypothetical protein
MPLPDPYETEPTKEIDRDKYQLWLEARAAVKAWQEEATRLATDLQESLQGMSAGTVDGRKVISYRYKDQYAVSRLMKDYPDLVQHFMHTEEVKTLDLLRFVAANPEVANRYRVREFRGLET